MWSLVATEYAKRGWPPQCHHYDVILTFTRKGIEVKAWFDGGVGIGKEFIPWEYIDAQRREVWDRLGREVE